jgi:sugar/nucleoside kinase (ribokinase family)
MTCCYFLINLLGTCDAKVSSDAGQDLFEISPGSQSMQLGVEVVNVAFLAAAVAVILAGRAVEIEAGVGVVVERARAAPFITADFFNPW